MSISTRVEQGDALAVRGVAALVIPANRQLTLGWGSHLAEAVQKHAGPDPEREALARFPEGVGMGDAVLTGSGALEGFTHLIHAAVLDKYDMNPLFLLKLKERTPESVLRPATRRSLELAADAGLNGLVLTPMGAGIGGMKSEKCARIMVEEVRAFAAARPEVALKVVFACWKEKDAARFRAALEV